jgi:hypothetical protein
MGIRFLTLQTKKKDKNTLIIGVGGGFILWVMFICCCSHDKLGDAVKGNKLLKPFNNILVVYN